MSRDCSRETLDECHVKFECDYMVEGRGAGGTAVPSLIWAEYLVFSGKSYAFQGIGAKSFRQKCTATINKSGYECLWCIGY